jgi:hypothetical protein
MSQETRIVVPLLCVFFLLAGLIAGFYLGQSTSKEIPATALATGSTQFRWLPPTENIDGSPLTDLAGFVIRCWNQSGQLALTRVVDDPSANDYVADNVRPGVYHCAVAAVNQQGTESGLSNMVAKLVPSGARESRE